MILHEHRCVFFHVPKTAGYAMERALLPRDLDYRVYHPEHIFGLKDGVMTQHLPYGLMLEIAGQAVLDSYFKFAFVRNPWDRLVSAYCYLKPIHDRQFGGFDGWLHSVCRRVREGRYHATDHIAPQMPFLRHEGREVLDFVGRYERVQDDFAAVLKRLELPCRELPRRNRSSLREGHYSRYYNAETRRLVAETYAEEIAALDYRYEPL